MAEQDLDAMLRRMSQTKVNRRSFLGAAGLTGAARRARGLLRRRHDQRRPERRARRSAAASAAAPPRRVASAERVAAGRRRSKKSCYMYNWSEYIDPEQHRGLQGRVRGHKFQYDIYDNNEELIAKLQGGAGGYDIAAPTAEYVPGMVEGGFLQKLDKSPAPEPRKYINEKFKGLWWDPTDEYHDPEGLRHDRHPVPRKTVPSVPQSWEDFYDLVKGEASGKTVFVDSMGDVFVFPLKMKGYSLNSVDKEELEEARTGPARRRAAHPRARLEQVRRQDRPGEAAVALGWTGPCSRNSPEDDSRTRATSCRAKARSSGWTRGSCSRTRRTRTRRMRGSTSSIEPEIQAKETNYNLYAHAQRRGEAARGPGSPCEPGGLPARRMCRQAQGAAGHLGQQPAHRHLGGVQAEDRRLTAARPGGRVAMTDTAVRGTTGGVDRRSAPLPAC